jgi:hypothetical protein
MLAGLDYGGLYFWQVVATRAPRESKVHILGRSNCSSDAATV